MPKQRPHDMREEVRDHFFRPITADGRREERSRRGWWNAKAGLFAHAVAAALDGEPWKSAFSRFGEGGWNHEVVNRFAYIQIKKIGGAGTANASEIREHGKKYRDVLNQQTTLYQPHLVLGCGVGSDSPAGLLAEFVLLGGNPRETSDTTASWWEFSEQARPRALVQLWHPAKRGSRAVTYKDVWSTVREVARATGLVGRRYW